MYKALITLLCAMLLLGYALVIYAAPATTGRLLATTATPTRLLITKTPTSQPTVTRAPTRTPTATKTPARGDAQRLIGYFVAWGVYDRNYHVANIPAEKLTHINYAFANISDAGECLLGDAYADTEKFYAASDSWHDPAGTLRGSFNQLRVLKAAHPQLKTLISVGGWSWSGKFSDVALTAASRQKFAQSCVAFLQRYGFDGLDIDWEFPVSGGLAGNTARPADKQNFTLLLAELRSQLDAQGTTAGVHYLLTIAAPSGAALYANLELNKLHQHVDWINLMAYDFHGSWESSTNFLAPLHAAANDPAGTQANAAAALQAYLTAGVPAAKLVLGVPFYGVGWAGVADVAHGLYQASTGLPPGTWAAGAFDYRDLQQHYLANGYTRYWQTEAQSSWLYNPATHIFISYDDVETMQHKANYVLENDLGGVMFWELSADDTASPTSLLNTLYTALLMFYSSSLYQCRKIVQRIGKSYPLRKLLAI